VFSRVFSARRSGAAAVEFALVAPLLMVTVLGVFEFGRMALAYQTLNYITRAAARMATLPGSAVSTDSVRSLIRRKLSVANLDSANAQITVTGAQDSVGTPATITILYPYRFVILHPLGGAAPSLTLGASALMRNE
jgi:Flp pilus assembly protein TadG